MAAGAPDIALLNMVMPDGRSMDLVSSPPEANLFPVVMMAGSGDEKTSVAAMKAGALDYVVKSPQAFAVMPRILSRALGRWQLIQERRRAEDAWHASERDFRLLTDYHRRLNEISISFTEAVGTDDLFNRIAESFRFLAGAIAATFSVYDQETCDLRIASISTDPVSMDKVGSIFGPGLFEMRMPVSAANMEHMLGQGISKPMDLHELSFGVIPLDISDAVMEAVGCRQIVALAISYAAELVGACVAYLPGDQPAAPDGVLKTYIYLAGLAVKRRWAERDLRESEKKYRQLVENVNDVVFSLDATGCITYISPVAQKLFGYADFDMIGRHFSFFIPAQDRPALETNWSRLKFESGWSLEFRGLDSAGNLRYLSAVVQPMLEQGKVKSISGMLSDITIRRRLEEEQQRVARLESVGVLAGGIAHDFNNILTAILGNISLARMDAAPGSEIQESLEHAEKASLRAKDLTLQLLTFSKGGAPVKELASLTELLKDTANSALTGSKVKGHFSIPADLWQAEIDARQVSQVIYNLVTNARQAMPAGGTIEISAENIVISEKQSLGNLLPLKEGDYIRVRVADHGCGIPAEHLEKIFDPFFTTKINASGLGVATSFSIARQHDGYLSVESEVGSGSTFSLYLPASASKQDKKKAIKAPGKARILVMDDEQGVRQVAGRMLRHLGYQDVEFATDGSEAIKLYKAAMKSGQPFRVAIIDLTIPGGHGGEWTIRKLLEIDPGVKAIVCSGYVDDPVMARYRDYGFSGMVAKPYTLAELGKAVQDVIG